MANAMVRTENLTVPQDKQKWLLNRITDGAKKVTLDLSTFIGDSGKEAKYFASIDDENTVAYLYSGIPLARIGSTNNFGPYDPTASDGRQTKVAGFLESQVKVEFTRKGLKEQYVDSALRYMAVIDKSELPVTIDNAKVDGLILSYDAGSGSDVEMLSTVTASGSYTLPAASTTALGGVKQVNTPGEDSVSALKNALKLAGIFAS